MSSCWVWPRSAAETPTKLFSCSIGDKQVSVTAEGGRLVYRYGTASKTELSIVGIPASENVFQMSQRFTGPEYPQLRFKSGDYSYIVYESEGSSRVDVPGTSGLVVMRGTKQLADKSCSHFSELTMPDEALGIPEAYSAM